MSMIGIGREDAGESRLGRITVTVAQNEKTGDAVLDIVYLLMLNSVITATFVNPGIVRVTMVEATGEARVSQPDRTTPARIVFEWPAGTRAISETVRLRAEWGPPTASRLNGAAVCVIPAYLPQLMSAHSRYFRNEATRVPTSPEPLPRIEVLSGIPRDAGVVADAAGETLMVALVMNHLPAKVMHASATTVLAGAGFVALESRELHAFSTRVDEMHKFVDGEFGHGHCVRVLVVAEKEANAHSGGKGQYVALEPEWFARDPANGTFIAEHIIVRQMTSIWWTFGLSLTGEMGQSVTEGIAIYASLRWLQATGQAEDLEVNLGRWRDRRDRIAKEGIASNPFIWYAANMALGLFEHSAIAERVLRPFAAEHWGTAVPVASLTAELTASIERSL